jgi:protein-L-isoaspartate(D-aspartate) O-methyltransferase
MDSPVTATRWRQLNLWCRDWQAAETMAVRELRPRLAAAEHEGQVASWWFVRKACCWRVRVLPAGNEDSAADASLRDLAGLLRQSGTADVTPAVYEPETHAFGGQAGMDTAHRLFHADSRCVLAYLAAGSSRHRRELGLVLAAILMRAAGQDWYEQGDIWRRVQTHRRPAGPQEPLPPVAVCRLISGGTPAASSPLTLAPAWPAAFERAGEALADMAAKGTLTRGLRAVLAQHVLFAWNRLGIAPDDQYALAASAGEAVFGDPPPPAATTVSAVTTDSTGAATRDPQQLRHALADSITADADIHDARVIAAFRAVPRHLFLPGTDMREAYAPQVVVTKRAADGSALSSASLPSLVAAMLQQLDVRPGHRILEIGTGTGINAALLAELTGPDGHVTTIDIDEDITTAAARSLAKAGYEHVRVVCADGADGFAPGTPYDRIIVTAGAWDLPGAWWQQLAGQGRIVVPLRLHSSGLTRSVAFDRQPDRHLASTSLLVCGFVPMRGSAASNGGSVQLAEGVTVHTEPGGQPREGIFPHALGQPGHEQWTGITVSDHDPGMPHLDLWLATMAASSRFGRISVQADTTQGLVPPARRWAGAALLTDTAIAYLTTRPRTPGICEVGVAAYGPGREHLATLTVGLLHRWNDTQPRHARITAHPEGTPDEQLPHGTRIDRPATRFTVRWP